MSSKKRGAEIQLTRELVDDDEIQEVNPSERFKKADESVLASRPMRGLPKRGNAAAATYDAPGSEKNLNFGVGSQASSPPSSSFTFNATLPTSSAAQPVPVNSQFKFSNSTVSTSASSVSKQLSNLLGSSPQPNGLHTAVPSARSSAKANDNAETKYFSSLRGLNEAFRVEVSNLLNSDPFTDLGGTLDVYKSFRSNIQKELSECQKPQGTSQTNGTSPLVFGSNPASGPVQTSTAPSLPIPPKAFAPFGAPSTSAPSLSMSGSAIGGFKPNFGASSSTSTTPATTAEKISTAPSPFAAPSSSAFNGKSSPFGTQGTTTKQSPFGGAASSSSPFGLTSSNPSTPFGSGSVFGGGVSSPDTSLNATTAPPNIFGASSMSNSTPTSTLGGFSFGGASGNLGNPVGFSFGGSATTAASEDSKEPAAGAASSVFSSGSKPTAGFGSSSTPGFSFGSGLGMTAAGNQDVAGASTKSSAPGSVTSAVESRSNTPFSTDGGEAPTEENAVPKALGENPNDLEGEGEEHEETVHASRVKIYRFVKAGGQPHWAEVGVGILRIKKHKESGSMRLLSRNSAHRKIMMNFKLYSGFKVSRAKQVLNFVGHDDGADVTFRVRVKDEAGATALQEAIEKAVFSL